MKNNIVGDNIRKLREKAGFSQMNLANFLNVDQSFVSKMEKGERPISVDVLEKLGTLFGVDYNSLDKEDIMPLNFSIAFRSNNLTSENMEAIYFINKIALNLDLMDELLEGKHD